MNFGVRVNGAFVNDLGPGVFSVAWDMLPAVLLGALLSAAVTLPMSLPLSATPLATVAMLSGIGAWNEFFWPFLVAKDETMQVLTVALQSFKSQTPQGSPDWSGLMAATALAVVPVLVLLFLFGRKVVESVQFSGSK